MIDKAIEKIKAEMEKNKDNGNVQVVGDFLLNQVEININAAKGILKEDKTIVESIKEMEKVALEKVKTKRGTQCVAIDPNEGFNIVMRYFGFEAIQDKIFEVDVAEIKETNNINTDEEVNVEKIDFNVNLDDFLK